MGNCRPISVLSVVARVFQRLIYDQLFAYINIIFSVNINQDLENFIQLLQPC